MRGTKFSILLAAVIVTTCAGSASAHDAATKKLGIKDHAAGITKRSIQVSSGDDGILYSDADDPMTNGASIHVYSATDNYCLQVPASAEWWKDTGKLWKYKNKDTKNQLQIGNGKLKVKIKSGVTYTLADDGTQGTVNAQVQFGTTGDRLCMKCTAPTKDEQFKYQAKDCAAAACDAEPPGCDPVATTTTTTSTTTSTSTSTTMPGTVVGALVKSPGRFNYTLALGLPAAETACDTNFPGSHACKYSELLASQGAPMTGLQDTSANPVTELWAIDPARPTSGQCGATTAPGATRWVYATGHLGVGGDFVSLDNGTGTLGTLMLGGGAVRNCFDMKWVACCQ